VIVLGIESATDLVGAAVGDGDGARAVLSVVGRRRHAETLAPAITEVLAEVGIGLGQLDAVALDVGPGLFTGLRVGVATAKGLAQALGIGVLALNSLEILAAAAFDSGWPGTVVPIVDARRGEVFAAHYGRGSGPGHLVELLPPGRHRPERVLLDVVPAGAGPVLACGDGALRYRDLLGVSERLVIAGGVLGAPDPAALVWLAAARIDAGAPLCSATDVQPLYLREADARINWVQRDPVVAREG
jgi:tRNA threonylcarbamoyladenosine biosynthesis protein TsaB